MSRGTGVLTSKLELQPFDRPSGGDLANRTSGRLACTCLNPAYESCLGACEAYSSCACSCRECLEELADEERARVADNETREPLDPIDWDDHHRDRARAHLDLGDIDELLEGCGS
jgi:hypothetical protein